MLVKKSASLLLAVIICLSLVVFSFASSTSIKETIKINQTKGIVVEGTYVADEASVVVAETNMERALLGSGALTVDEDLTAAANLRALEISIKWSHERPDGSQWNTVSSKAFGENIAYGQEDGKAVVYSWMHSRGHKTNIIAPRYTKIGVGAVEIDGVIYWVQLFG